MRADGFWRGYSRHGSYGSDTAQRLRSGYFGLCGPADFDRVVRGFYAQNATVPFSEDSIGWLGWPEAYRYPDSAAVLAFSAAHEADIRYYM